MQWQDTDGEQALRQIQRLSSRLDTFEKKLRDELHQERRNTLLLVGELRSLIQQLRDDTKAEQDRELRSLHRSITDIDSRLETLAQALGLTQPNSYRPTSRPPPQGTSAP